MFTDSRSGIKMHIQVVFVITNIKSSILGADFLRYYSLLVDMKHSWLVDAITQVWVNKLSSQMSLPSPALYCKQRINTSTAIVAEYPAVF